MIMIQSTFGAIDNAGAILLKCIKIFHGYARRYARLGEMVSSVSKTRKAYKKQTDKAKLAKLSKKVKKKRKIKNKKKKQPNLRPYLSLLVGLKKITIRKDGTMVQWDKNISVTLTEPVKFGPAGKTENIPNVIGTKVKGPVCMELVKDKKMKIKFNRVIARSGGLV